MDFGTWSALRRGIHFFSEELKHQSPGMSYCHYTSPHSFISIFEKHIQIVGQRQYKDAAHPPIQQCIMRASHLRFLNDSQEYLNGLDWLNRKMQEECVQGFKDECRDNMYSISFCGNDDLLSQWKWYGKDSGIAISFDMSNIQYKYYDYYDNIQVSMLPSTDTHTMPLPVKYTDDEKLTYYNQIKNWNKTDQIRQSLSPLLAGLFIPFCKHEGFQEEKESRLIFYTADMDSTQKAGLKPFQIHYYTSGATIKPSLDVIFQAKDPNKSIVNCLTVGPGQNQELIYKALVHMLSGELPRSEKEDVCIDGIMVKKSRIPFRG